MLFSSLLCCLILECYYSVWSLWVSSHLFSWLFSVAFVWRKGPTWSLSAEITQDTQKHSTQTPTVLSQAGFMIPVCISLNIQVTCMHFEAWNFLLYNTGYIFRLKMGFSPSSTLLLSEPMEQKASFRLFWSSRVICGHPQPLSLFCHNRPRESFITIFPCSSSSWNKRTMAFVLQGRALQFSVHEM